MYRDAIGSKKKSFSSASELVFAQLAVPVSLFRSAVF
jgi:hypothetical protein